MRDRSILLLILNKQKSMKTKIFSAAVIAAMALVSCSQESAIDETATAGQGHAINFGTFMGKPETRGTVLDLPGLKIKGFIVQAYNTDNKSWIEFTPGTAPNFMWGSGSTPTLNTENAQAVTWDSGNSEWIYSPTKYWPANDGAVTFFAYGASDATSSSPNGLANFTSVQTEGVAPKFDFTVNGTVSNQVDLVADALFDGKYSTGAGISAGTGKVKFAFDHILSKVGFSAKTAVDYSSEATVTVTDLSLAFVNAAVQTNGTFSFGNSDASLGSWSLTDNAAGSAITAAYIPIAAQDLYTGAGVVLGNSTSAINDDSKYLMLIPQTIAADALTATITYTIKAPVADGQTTTYTVVKKLPAVTLEMGKQYTFNFTITLNAVIFEGITVNPWADGTQPADTGL
jgi:hypothetical protein